MDIFLKLGFFYFNCEHFLFVYTVKQKEKKGYGFYKKSRRFSKLNDNPILLEANFFNFDHS